MNKRFSILAMFFAMSIYNAHAKTDIYPGNLIITGNLWNQNNLIFSTVPGMGPINTLGQVIYKTKNLFSYVKLSLNTNDIPTGLANFAASITLTIKYYIENPNGLPFNPVTVTKTLDVNYDNGLGAKYKNIDIEKIDNAARIEVSFTATALNVTPGTITPAHKNFIRLEVFTEHERYYNFNNVFGNSGVTDFTSTLIGPADDIPNREITLTWNPITYAEGYELEYTFVENYGDAPGVYIPQTELNFSFKNNSTRILLQTNHYTMPLVQEHGWLLYRVRGFGMAGNNFERIFFGDFGYSTGASNPNQVFNVDTYPNRYFVLNFVHASDKINWQSVTSFAEEGKSKMVVTYMDGTMRTRQTVTSNSTEKNAIVAETIYDFQGRPAVNILPAPVKDAAIKYYPNFNQNMSGQPYSYNDFDFKGNSSCDPFNIGPLKQQTSLSPANIGAGNYYSEYNPNKSAFNAFIPEAKGYPFTRVTYMPDATDRVVRQGSVGEVFQPGNTGIGGVTSYQSHDTKYYYGKPEQEKLDQLFGSNVGYTEFYQKNLIVDPNGQASVSYVDLDGKTIATALAGDAPLGMVPLQSIASNFMQVDLLSGSDIVDNGDHSITNSRSFLVLANKTKYSFQYSLQENIFNSLSCQGKNYCLDCIYDLEITLIKDECAKVEYSNKMTLGKLKEINFACNDANTATAFNFKDTLDIGSYTITKKLTVNKQAGEKYADSIVNDPGNTCLKTFDDFYNEAWNNRDTTRCMEACDACITEANNSDSTALISAALKSCDSLWCKPQMATMCDIARMSMINDLTPGGQYALCKDAAGNFDIQISAISIFNNHTIPQGALKLMNAPGNIMVQLPGEPSRPLSYYATSDVLIEQLINNWPQDLSEQLLPLHPEYCYLQFCALDSVQSSNNFDTKYMSAGTFAEAQAAGFGSLSVINSLYLQDPLYGYMGQVSSILQTQMSDRFDKYAGPGNSILKLALVSANCPSTSNINTCPGVWGDGINDDDEWQRFKAFYYSIKQEFIQKAREFYVKQHNCCLNEYIGCKDGGCFVNVWNNMNMSPYNINPCLNNTLLEFYKAAKRRFTTINDIDFPAIPNPPKSIYDMTPQEQADYVKSDSIKSPCPSCPELDAFKMMIWHIQSKGWIKQNKTVPADAIAGLKDALRIRFVGSAQNENITINHSSNTDFTISSKNCTLTFKADTTIDWEKAEILPTCLEIKDYKNAKLHIMVNGAYKTVLNISSTCDIFYCDGEKPATPTPDNSCHCDSVYNSKTLYHIGDIVQYKGICYIVKKVNNKNGDLTPGYHPGNKEFWDKLCEHTNTCVNPFVINFDNAETYTTGLTAGDTPVQPDKYVIRNKLKTSKHTINHTSNAMFARPGNTSQYHLLIQKTATVLPNTNYKLSFDAVLLVFPDPDCFWLTVKINNQVVYDNKCIQDRTQPWIDQYGWDNYSFNWNSGNNTTVNVEISSNKQNETDIIGIDNLQMLCQGSSIASNNGNNSNTANTAGNKRYIPQSVCGCNGLCDAQLPSPPLPFIPCDSIQKIIATQQATDAYRKYKDSVFNAILNGYYAKCMQSMETFSMDYKDAEYHYTLYYYDQSGNLVKTVPPAGVKAFTTVAQLQNVVTARNNPALPLVEPAHIMTTHYEHNSLNAVVWQKTPDAGESEFYYDKLGRIALSRNAKQKPANHASYSYYDKQGRNVEAGQIDVAGMTVLDLQQETYSNTTWPAFINGRSRTEITHTYFDVAAKPRISNGFGAAGQKNLRNRIATVAVFDTDADLTTFTTDADLTTIQYSHATHYQYDIAGNVTELLQDFGKYSMFGFNPNNVRLQSKHIAYKFDLISGKVNDVLYQKGFEDQFFYRYNYNADNKLTKVFSSSNGIVWENDARYIYYRHGPLARTEFGTDNVQGTDYAYTLQGWMKGVNGLANNAQTDMGKDGNAIPVSSNIGYSLQNKPTTPDVYSYWLSYFNNDYQAIGNSASSIANTIQPLTTGIYHTDPAPLYNGNIRSMYTNLQPFGGLGMRYTYDQLNRIKQQTGYTFNSGSFALTANNAYAMNLDYDASGNIQKLLRNGKVSVPAMDSLNYVYYTASGNTYSGNPTATDATNKLAYVTDLVSNSNNYTDDIDNQQPNNYSYDAIGNLIRDNSEGITSIDWNLQNKITGIQKNNGTSIGYGYDALGNRVLKGVTDNTNPQNNKTEIYVRDAQGNTLAVYRKKTDSTFIQELQLYGSSRLGVQSREVIIAANYFPINQTPVLNVPMRPYYIESYRNTTQYELTNHLGNVLATVSDAKTIVAGNNAATLLTATDYYAFGMAMPDRKYPPTGDGYRYGMNGQEKSNEIFENSFSAEYWEYDTRIGRRWNTDPKPIIGISDYACFLNSPILLADPDGDVIDYGQKGDGRITNKINAWFARNFGKGHNEFAKQFKAWEASEKTYELEMTVNNDRLREVRNGSSSIIKDENDPNRMHVYYSRIGQIGPDPEDKCFDNPCIPPSQTVQRPKNVGSRITIGNFAIPKSTSNEIIVSEGSTIQFIPKDYNDRLRIYSGKHKIYDTHWIRRKNAKEIVIIDLDIHFKKGEIECNTIRVRTTSGPDRRTDWSTRVIVPGNVD